MGNQAEAGVKTFAVASQNFRTITPHGGRTRRFLVFRAEPGGEPVAFDRLELPREMALHEFHDDGPHPLYDMDVILVGSAGPGFIRHLAARRVEAIATAETDPVAAIKAYFAGTLPPAGPHDEGHGHHGPDGSHGPQEQA